MKRSRERNEHVEFLSLKDVRRKRRSVKLPFKHTTNLVFAGPKALDLFHSTGRLVENEFIQHVYDIVKVSKGVVHYHALQSNPPFLPPQLRSVEGRKTLVLDIDETLVHSVTELDPKVIYDHTFDVECRGVVRKIGMNKRPHVDQFLEFCGQHFEVVTFTSALKNYADQVLNILDPKKEFIRHRLYREQCIFSKECIYFKNLDYLRRDIRKTMIVDNCPFVFTFHLNNGIPIQSYYGGDDEAGDTELLKLINFLKELVHVEDVRTVIEGHFKMSKLMNYVSNNPSTIHEEA